MQLSPGEPRPLDEEFPLTPELQRDIDNYIFADGGWTGPIGASLGTLTTTALAWEHLNQRNLVIWSTVGLLLAIALTAVSVLPKYRRPVDAYGSPWTLNIVALLIGAHFGAVMWIDLAAMADPEVRLTLLSLLLAVSAVSAAGTAAIGGQGRWVQYSMWCSPEWRCY